MRAERRPGPYAHSIETIVGLLSDRAEDLARSLVPGGRREGDQWADANVVRGGMGDSLKINLRGKPSFPAGNWKHFATGDGGDALDLIAYLRTGGDKAEAIRWAKAWLGLDGTNPQALRETQAAKARAAQADDTPPPDLGRAAFRIWLAARERIRDTPADAYLQGRGLNLDLLARQPRALRFHPALWCEPAKAKHPALVAGIGDAHGHIRAVHRTWLQPDGADGWRKLAGVPKMSLGPVRGGSIRVWRGASNLPLAQAPADEEVVITEGLEDALTVALACPEMRVLCAVSLANMANIVLPPAIGGVIICADNDGDNAAARQGLDRAIGHFQRQFKSVRLARSPVGKDMNDLLNSGDAA